MRNALLVLAICVLSITYSWCDTLHGSDHLLAEEMGLFIQSCGLDTSFPGDTRSDKERRQELKIKEAERRALLEASFFKESAELAARTITAYCSGQNRVNFDLFASIEAVANSLKAEALEDDIPWSTIEENDEVDLDDLIDRLLSDFIRDVQIPSVGFRKGNPPVLSGNGFYSVPTDQIACDNAVKNMNAQKNCNHYMEEFHHIYKQVQALYAREDALNTAAKLKNIDRKWTIFMERTVDQTPLELWWNGYWFKRKNRGYRTLSSPPNTQQIFLKPYVAGDYLGEAPDGAQLNEAIVLDVWGIKRVTREREKWYTPMGASVHLAASDRPEAEDWGYGISIHFTEMHTIGVTSYDGDLAVFLSFDLWKNATDKYDTVNKRIEEYRTISGDFLSNPVEFLKEKDQEQ